MKRQKQWGGEHSLQDPLVMLWCTFYASSAQNVVPPWRTESLPAATNTLQDVLGLHRAPLENKSFHCQDVRTNTATPVGQLQQENTTLCSDTPCLRDRSRQKDNRVQYDLSFQKFGPTSELLGSAWWFWASSDCCTIHCTSREAVSLILTWLILEDNQSPKPPVVGGRYNHKMLQKSYERSVELELCKHIWL